MSVTCDLCGSPLPVYQTLNDDTGAYVTACEKCRKLGEYLRGWK